MCFDFPIYIEIVFQKHDFKMDIHPVKPAQLAWNLWKSERFQVSKSYFKTMLEKIRSSKAQTFEKSGILTNKY